MINFKTKFLTLSAILPIVNIAIATDADSPAVNLESTNALSSSKQVDKALPSNAQKIPLKTILKTRVVKNERADITIADFKSIKGVDVQKTQTVGVPYLHCLLYFAPDTNLETLDEQIIANMPERPVRGVPKPFIALEKYFKSIKIKMESKPYSFNQIKQSIQNGIPAVANAFILLKDLENFSELNKARAATPTNKEWQSFLKQNSPKVRKTNAPTAFPLIVIGFNAETKEVLVKQGIQEPIWLEESYLKAITKENIIFDL